MASVGPWLGGTGNWAFDPFSYDIWDPFETFDYGLGVDVWDTPRRRRRGGRRRGSSQEDTSAVAHINVDWRETENAHIFRADLPGVKKEDVKVQVEDGNVLHISGEIGKVEESQGDTWRLHERQRGSFSRRFRLPKNANLDEIKCSMENGVLTICVPKKESPQPSANVRTITIE